MDILALTGFIGAIFSILAFFMTDSFKSKKWIKLISIALIIGLCCVITYQSNKLSRINKVSKSATSLITNKGFNYTQKSFVQAGLTFLESNKDLYPDSYERAVSLYETYKQEVNPYSNEVVDLASEIEGIIKGIAVLNSEK